MPILPVPAAMQSSSRGFYPKTINGSLRFNDDDSAYLSWTPASASNRKTWTMSFWFKKCKFATDQMIWSVGTGTYKDYIRVSASDDKMFFVFDNGGTYVGGRSAAVLRDPSAWYHLVIQMDTANSYFEVYLNGEKIEWTTKNAITANYTPQTNSAQVHNIGRYAGSSNQYWDGYLAEFFFIDGTKHEPTDFAETKNGVWVPKNVTSTDFTMGTNGFHLPMTDDTEVEAFNTVLYKGTGKHNTSVTGVGFTPDLVWIKDRDAANQHVLMDSVRGGNRQLNSSNTNTEQTQYDLTEAIESDGFSVGDNVAGTGATNISGNDYVAWCWDAGANNTITGHSSVTYTGNSSTQTIKGLPFTPDLVWIKSRTLDIAHGLFDTVRGFGVSGGTNTAIGTNRTDAEGNGNGNVTGVIPNGFMLAPGSSGSNPHHLTNLSSYNYVAWCWDAGDSNPATNSEGNTNCTLKSNGDFSIFTWDGTGSATTIGHGLDGTPDFFIVYNRANASENWVCWHNALSSATTSYIKLDLNEAATTSANVWGSTAPTATTIGVGTAAATNGTESSPTENMVCYAWRNVTGKQKFGSYTGNGSTSGPTVTTGFRPGFVMMKRTDSTGNWEIHDGSRAPLNPSPNRLWANLSNVESTSENMLNFTDTGFEIISNDVTINASGGTYIYAAFAGSYSDYITDYNTNGTVDSRVKASDTTGFSIVSWEGDGTTNGTFGHGLSSAPDFIVAKDRDSNSVNNNWHIWHTSLSSATHNLNFTTGAESNVATATSYGGIGDPSATTIKAVSGTVDSRTMNESGDRYIAYCWTETTGVSKFGSYTGNATSVDLGFNPAFILIKRITGTAKDWWIFDNTREVDGAFGDYLIPNQSYVEQTVATAVSVSGTTITFPNNWDSTHDGSASSTYIYAAFADTREAAFWLDQSSNNNDWQPVNLDHNDTVLDSPTDNYCTLNPLELNYVTLSDGNLVVQESAGSWRSIRANFMMPTGQWYWEFEGTATAANYFGGGISRLSEPLTSYVGNSANGYGTLGFNGNKYNSGAAYTFSDTYAVGDVIGVAFDADAGTLDYYKNGTLLGTAFTGLTSGDFFPAFSVRSSTVKVNFGQHPFKYGPPA